jgi:hypothetical protein
MYKPIEAPVEKLVHCLKRIMCFNEVFFFNLMIFFYVFFFHLPSVIFCIQEKICGDNCYTYGDYNQNQEHQ